MTREATQEEVTMVAEKIKGLIETVPEDPQLHDDAARVRQILMQADKAGDIQEKVAILARATPFMEKLGLIEPIAPSAI